MTWLGFSLKALARQQSIVLASVSHCPPPLQLPVGPIWACSQHEEAGYLLPGRPEIQLRQAARRLLAQPEKSAELNIPLNPWAGENDDKHTLQLYLRKLTGDDLQLLMLLEGKLRIGQCCELDLDKLLLRDHNRYPTAISAQALETRGKLASFAPTAAHIAVFGAGALAHQVIKLLSNSPFTLHWIANATERVSNEQAANILFGEATDSTAAPLPDNSHCLVMTHDHALDLQLCAELAAQASVHSVGVVGSGRKSQALQRHLATQPLNQQQLAKIRCPLGGRNTINLHSAALNIVHEASTLASNDNSG